MHTPCTRGAVVPAWARALFYHGAVRFSWPPAPVGSGMPDVIGVPPVQSFWCWGTPLQRVGEQGHCLAVHRRRREQTTSFRFMSALAKACLGGRFGRGWARGQRARCGTRRFEGPSSAKVSLPVPYDRGGSLPPPTPQPQLLWRMWVHCQGWIRQPNFISGPKLPLQLISDCASPYVRCATEGLPRHCGPWLDFKKINLYCHWGCLDAPLTASAHAAECACCSVHLLHCAPATKCTCHSVTVCTSTSTFPDEVSPVHCQDLRLGRTKYLLGRLSFSMVHKVHIDRQNP